MPCVFSKQSLPLFLCDLDLLMMFITYKLRHTLFQSYGVILPSSLTRVLSSALGFSPHLPVSVLVRTNKHHLNELFSKAWDPEVYGLLKFVLLITSQINNRSSPSLGPNLSIYWLKPHMPLCGSCTLLCPSFKYRYLFGAGIFACLPSSAPFGLPLGSD